jgi:hypothetical protein
VSVGHVIIPCYLQRSDRNLGRLPENSIGIVGHAHRVSELHTIIFFSSTVANRLIVDLTRMYVRLARSGLPIFTA